MVSKTEISSVSFTPKTVNINASMVISATITNTQISLTWSGASSMKYNQISTYTWD